MKAIHWENGWKPHKTSIKRQFSLSKFPRSSTTLNQVVNIVSFRWTRTIIIIILIIIGSSVTNTIIRTRFTNNSPRAPFDCVSFQADGVVACVRGSVGRHPCFSLPQHILPFENTMCSTGYRETGLRLQDATIRRLVLLQSFISIVLGTNLMQRYNNHICGNDKTKTCLVRSAIYRM